MSLRVHVFREDRGVRKVLIVPGRSLHLAPILAEGATKKAVMDQVAAILASPALQHDQQEPAAP